MFIWIVAPVEDPSGRCAIEKIAIELADTSVLYNISDAIQSFDHGELRSISQLIKGKWRDLQKLHVIKVF